MTAVITDIAEYRARRGVNDAAAIVYFSDWTDERIVAQYNMLGFIRDGHDELIDMSRGMARAAFPNGYDPDTHLEDNIDAVYAEGLRRGVFLTSA